jgi:hypothetical protein
MFMVAIGAAAIGWTISVTPNFWAYAPIADVADHIIAGETYKPDMLDGLAAGLSNSRAHPHRWRRAGGGAVLRLLGGNVPVSIPRGALMVARAA